jgi:hypothetical protein
MADEEKKILIDIQSNLDQATKDAVDYGKQIDELKQEIKGLNKEDENYNQVLEEKKTQLRESQKQYRESTKTIDEMTRANKAQSGSYDELQAQLRLAERELKSQSGLLTKNADGTIQLSEGYLEASKKVENARNAVNQFNLGINQGNTNVGLYQQSIEKAMGSVNVFGVSGTKAFGALQGGIGSFIKSSLMGLKALAKAFLANPVGIIIMAIIGAIALLVKAWRSFTSRYYETTDKMAAVIAGIKAAFDALVDAFVNFFRRSEKAGKSVREVYLEAKKLAEEARKLKDDMKEFEQTSAKASLEMAKLEMIYKDVTKSEEERLAAAKEAMAIEAERADKELEMAKENLRIIAEKNKLSKSGREDKEAEIEAQSKVYQLEEASLKTRIKINRTLSSLERELNKEKEDYAKREQKAVIDLMKLRAGDNINELKKVLKQEYEISLRNEKLTTTERLLLKEQYHAAVLALDNKEKADLAKQESEYSKLMADQEEQRRLSRLAAYDKRKSDRLKDKQDQLELDSLQLEEQRMLDNLTAEQVYEATRSILEQQRALALSNKNLSDSEIAVLDQQFKNLMLQNEEKYNAAKQQMSDIRVQMARDEMAAIGGALGALSDLMGKETAVGKAFAVAQATINTYLAASQVLADPRLSTVAKVASMIGIIASGIANVRKILAVDVSGRSAPTMSGSASRGGNVATRAGGAIAGSNETIGNVGASINVPPGNAATGKSSNSNEDLINAIKNIPAPKLIIEEFDEKRNRMRKIESTATF